VPYGFEVISQVKKQAACIEILLPSFVQKKCTNHEKVMPGHLSRSRICWMVMLSSLGRKCCKLSFQFPEQAVGDQFLYRYANIRLIIVNESLLMLIKLNGSRYFK
jgi:hypothetical protein